MTTLWNLAAVQHTVIRENHLSLTRIEEKVVASCNHTRRLLFRVENGEIWVEMGKVHLEQLLGPGMSSDHSG